jgi:hypothetical protein
MSEDNLTPIEALSVDAELKELDNILQATQRLWLIERSESGVWGVGIVHDLAEHQWPNEEELGRPIYSSDKFETIAYRRHENLAKAIYDARVDVQIRNENEATEAQDAEAEEKFLQPINPDPITGIASKLKSSISD